MAVSLRDEDVQALHQALTNGKTDLETLLSALQGTSVERIHQGLEGTKTAVAFDQNITEFIASLTAMLPRFEELGQFVTQYLADFHQNDESMASSLR